MTVSVWISLLSIAVGATLGAWGRWGLSLWFNAPDSRLPLGTLFANIIGGFLIGLILAWIHANPKLSPLWRLFWVTGLLGGLTTFSSFSFENYQLLMQQDWLGALNHLACHAIGSIVATYVGVGCFKLVVSV